MRLLQIEGPTFTENVRNTFMEEGILEEKVEDVLVWAIGDDFHTILLKYWPYRIRTRIKLDVKDGDRVKDTIIKLAKAWKNREKNDNHRDT